MELPSHVYFDEIRVLVVTIKDNNDYLSLSLDKVAITIVTAYYQLNKVLFYIIDNINLINLSINLTNIKIHQINLF